MLLCRCPRPLIAHVRHGPILPSCSKSSQLSGDTLVLILLNFSRLFVLSLLLGAGVGLASAYLIKQSFVHHSTDREVGCSTWFEVLGVWRWLWKRSRHWAWGN